MAALYVRILSYHTTDSDTLFIAMSTQWPGRCNGTTHMLMECMVLLPVKARHTTSYGRIALPLREAARNVPTTHRSTPPSPLPVPVRCCCARLFIRLMYALHTSSFSCAFPIPISRMASEHVISVIFDTSALVPTRIGTRATRSLAVAPITCLLHACIGTCSSSA